MLWPYMAKKKYNGMVEDLLTKHQDVKIKFMVSSGLAVSLQ